MSIPPPGVDFMNPHFGLNVFIRLPGMGSKPGIFWFRLFSHSITLLLSHSGSPRPKCFRENILSFYFR
jgi:hypothetical protein